MQNRINLRNNPMETVKDLVVDNLTGGAISGNAPEKVFKRSNTLFRLKEQQEKEIQEELYTSTFQQKGDSDTDSNHITKPFEKNE